jgi:hypothetical protein
MYTEEQLQEEALIVQQESHATIENIVKNNNRPITYADAQYCFFFRKLAELQLRITELENKSPTNEAS